MALVTCADCGNQVSDAAISCPACGRPMHTRPVRLHWLGAIACLVVVLAGAGYAIQSVNDGIALAHALGHPGEMESLAYTSAEAAHITFTNLSEATLYQCVRAVVRTKDRASNANSVAVCTGDVKPHTSAVIEAPYKVGAVKAICSGEPDRFGTRQVDWDLCEFYIEAAMPGKGGAAN